MHESDRARHDAINEQFAAQLRGVLTDQQAAELARRNEQSLAAARASLGDRWLLHPTKRVQRKGMLS